MPLLEETKLYFIKNSKFLEGCVALVAAIHARQQNIISLVGGGGGKGNLFFLLLLVFRCI